ncbi:carotenoid ester lipase precursor [Fomes fomentarius]|nr:carotenoid ester lipase precursor [Fomes fomentarius]
MHTRGHLQTVQVLSALLYFSLTRAVTADGSTAPTVQLDAATVIGTQNGSVDSFLGIPFAQPPVGNLRLRLPELLTSYNGTVNATAFGNQCIQQPPLPLDAPQELLQDVITFISEAGSGGDFGVPHSEDCLYLNVIRPANISAGANLPVLAWIYGGAFAQGSNAMENYNGSAIVQRSIDIGEPIIYVAMNYRVNVFGFLGGKEVKEEGVGNLGLQDQRAGLRWIHKFISSFGGDPTKVTIWGQSAGSASVALQMLHNDGDPEGLFRAGIMNSGSFVYTKDVTELQDTYNSVVDQVGCSGAPDSLACLRTISTDSLIAAANNTLAPFSRAGLALPYMPRADGQFLKQPIPELVLNGKLAKIPFIIGDVKDEGTLFSIVATDITTDDEFTKYIQTWFPEASPADLQPILEAYSSDPADGSPFDTGDANAFASQYKRVSALQGDLFFNAPRRVLLDKYSPTQPTYNFVINGRGYPGLGIAHGADTPLAYKPGDMIDYFVRFVNDLNPNSDTGVQWPKYDAAARLSLEFSIDVDTPLRIVADDARSEAMGVVSALSLRFPF